VDFDRSKACLEEASVRSGCAMGKDAKGELDTEGKHIVYPIGIRIWSDGQTPDSKPTVLELVVAAVSGP
jgi:hypothetical protein